MDELRDIAVVGAAVVGLIVLVLVAVTALERRQCQDVADMSGRQTRYAWRSGCYVQDNAHGWVPLKNWRVED